VLAGEGTPLQDVEFGLLFAGVGAAIVAWPRQALTLGARWWRWNQRHFGDPDLGARPEPGRERTHATWLVTAYRLLALVVAGAGIALAIQGLSHM
jgi:hypothetical protein